MPADFAKTKDLFLAVLDMPPAERSTYLDTACAGDTALRQQIEAMLKSHEHSGELLERAPAEMLQPGSTDGDGAKTAIPFSPATVADGNGAAQPDDLAFLSRSSKPGLLGHLGHYEIEKVLGKGGFGIVLKAFDERLHRVAAIKVLSSAYAGNGSARKRFIREARAAAAVKNEHVVGIHDVQEDAQPPYLVMEYIDGITLQDKIDRQGALGVKEILRIGIQIAEGLAAAHKQGLVHRDIKPANILLENGVERVKITDFGLARAVDDASLTQSGTVAGTPLFMSPEQAEGKSVDHRSDLFSLGTVMYTMCAGHPPFRATGTLAVLKRVIEDRPGPIREINSEIPDWLEAIVAKLHAKKQEDRFQTAKEAAELLGQYLAHVQRPDLPAPKPLPAPVPYAEEPQTMQLLLDKTESRRRGVQHFLLLVTFILGVTAFLVATLPGPPAQPLLLLLLGTAVSLWFGRRLVQSFKTTHRGHRIRVETGHVTAEKLFIDDVLVARRFGRRTDLRGALPNGADPYTTIVVHSEAGLYQIRCRIYAETDVPASEVPGRETADVQADCDAQLKTQTKLMDFSRIPQANPQYWGRRKWVAVLILASIGFWFGPAAMLYFTDRGELEILPKNGLVSVIVLENRDGIIDGDKIHAPVTDWLDMKKSHTLTLPPGRYQVNVGTWPAKTYVSQWKVTTSSPFGSNEVAIPVINTSAIVTVARGHRVTLQAVINTKEERK